MTKIQNVKNFQFHLLKMDIHHWKELTQIFSIYSNHCLTASEKRGEIFPGPRKKCRKMVLFPKALFFLTFSKIKINKFTFSIDLSSKYFTISQQFEFFVQTCEKVTHGLLDLLKNMLKMHFFNFLNIFFEHFRSVPPPEKNPGNAHV